jgi:hypothetical protein
MRWTSGRARRGRPSERVRRELEVTETSNTTSGSPHAVAIVRSAGGDRDRAPDTATGETLLRFVIGAV